MTYQELYLQHLEAALAQGGKEAAINKAVSEFNNPTRAGFDEWLKDVPWTACSTCGDSFKPTDIEPAVTPDAEILCKTHSTSR